MKTVTGRQKQLKWSQRVGLERAGRTTSWGPGEKAGWAAAWIQCDPALKYIHQPGF